MIEAAKKSGETVAIPKAQKSVAMAQALPTMLHMALLELMNRGILKHVISQNTDGLHRKSGIPKDNITEVHGNRNLEVCVKCERDYMRDFGVRSTVSGGKRSILTGRKCDEPNCRGDLRTTTIAFG